MSVTIVVEKGESCRAGDGSTAVIRGLKQERT
jgi:hypothetical protein